MLAFLSLLIPIENTALDPNVYLRIPLIITVLSYWGGGCLLLRKGKLVLHQASTKIDAGITG